MYQYTESEKNAALRAADARKRYHAWMSKPFAGHDVRALRTDGGLASFVHSERPVMTVIPVRAVAKQTESELDAGDALAKLAAAWERGASREERVAVLRDIGALRHLEAPGGNLERAKALAEADKAIGYLLTKVLRERHSMRLRESPFPLTRVARLPRPSRPPAPGVNPAGPREPRQCRPAPPPARQTLVAWLKARLPRFGEQSAAQPFRDPRGARSGES